MDISIVRRLARRSRAAERGRSAIHRANALALHRPALWRRNRLGKCRAHKERSGNRLRAIPIRGPLAAAFEELNSTFVLERRRSTLERPKVSALASLRILLARVESVPTVFELSNHARSFTTPG